MSRSPFVGREHELERLKLVYNHQKPVLVVIKGRRRLGKSRLIKQFATQHPNQKFWSFAGLAPQDGITAQDQRDHFARKLALLLQVTPMTFASWTEAFEYLSLVIQPGDIILFDEISWMGAKDSTFIPKLKDW